MRIFKVLICCMCFISICAFATNGDSILSNEEKDWLEANSPISYAPDPDFAPFEYMNEDLELVGINIEYLKMIEDVLDIEITFKVVGDWEKTLDSVKNKKNDFITAAKTEQRQKHMLFTEDYIMIPSGIIVQKGVYRTLTPEELGGKKIAVVKGWVWEEIIKEESPDAIIVHFDSILEAMEAVAFGEVDATIQDLATASYQIEQNKITNLRLAGDFKRPLDLHFAIRKDAPLLKSILEKGINAIPDTEKDTLYNKWIRLGKIPFYETKNFMYFMLVLVLTLVLIVLWGHSLRVQVKDRTKDLQGSLDELNLAQRKLIEQEKMAALGGLSAGLSHEIKNPLGNSMTMISYMLKETDHALESVKNKKITVQAMIEYLEGNRENIELIERNLDMANELVNNFKTMAVDQIAESKTRFNLCDYLEKINKTMKYECSSRNVKVDLDCSIDILINSYPGVFGQIFTNLVLNSLIHGYEGRSSGKIWIQVKMVNDHLMMLYKDNGVGMSPEAVENVFKAFYTTKRYKGGSGMGMHIVYSLIKEKFEGDIICSSELDKGTMFSIQIPMEKLYE